ncbi:MAG: hypothetical protein A3J74_09640 [Elusimicrobia bacterium RIFCSPHIGHO2_02_FULL_57_9]|nr:MAG: hypothetical protein A3J74_09640 [Elusimicrobia bacterium RIFCSPHIGHO2_02_FULL_57_9]
MPALCGAWSLSGKSIEDCLPEPQRQAIRRNLPDANEPLVEKIRGPLWLVACQGHVAQHQEAVAAMEGLIAAETPVSLSSILGKKREQGDWEPRFDGHYILVWADAARRRLSLFRDPTGGFRLYYVQIGDLLLFSASAKALAAHDAVGRRLNSSVAEERVLAGLSHWGNETLWEGIREVLPGYCLEASPKNLRHRWYWGELLQGVEGRPEDLAPELAARVRQAVRASIGSDGRVAVALSGGIDSSAIAALAAKEVGAGNVEAFTYEFSGPDYVSEAHFAAQTCRHLGIKKHHILQISQENHLNDGLEMFWRSEDFINRWKQYPPKLARVLRQRGFSKFLTGDGIGSRMGWFEDLSDVMPWIPWRDKALRYWRVTQNHLEHGFDWLDYVHPGLTPPYRFLHLLAMGVLRAHGLIIKPLFPSGIGDAACRVLDSSRVRDAMQEIRHLPLARQLQHLSFIHLSSSIDTSRTEGVYRELGVLRVSPFFFPSCLALTHFPYKPKPFLWSSSRRMRPGKELLISAMRHLLPEDILYRPKLWIQASAPSSWLIRENDWIARRTLSSRLLPPFYENNERFIFPGTFRRGYLIALGLWHRMFMERSLGSKPPTWDDLSDEPRAAASAPGR